MLGNRPIASAPVAAWAVPVRYVDSVAAGGIGFDGGAVGTRGRSTVAAGSIEIGGAAVGDVQANIIAAGQFSFGGGAVVGRLRGAAAAGAVTIAGGAIAARSRDSSAAGGIEIGGSVLGGVFHPEDIAALGAITIGGSAIVGRQRSSTAAGGIAFGGGAIGSVTRDRRPSGAFAVVVEIVGWDPVAGAAVTLRASSLNDDRVCHLDAQVWWPTISKLPTLRYDLFDGAFTGRIVTPASSLSLAIEPWPNLARYALADARIRIWTGAAGDAFGSYTLRFDGRVQSQPVIKDGIADLSFAVDDRWLDQPLLATYAGTGAAEGDAALKGQAKPLAIGAPRFVPGKLIDSTNNVLQLSAYGAIEDVETAFERVARFTASVGDYASHAALVGATVRPGQWATSKASGLVRHGAPPQGLLSYDVKGDKAGPDGWVRLPGSVIRRIALLAGGSGKINDASLTALDASRPWNISLYVDSQVTARELIQRIAASVNAVAGVDWLGQLFVAPIGFATATVTLDATGAALPPVAAVQQLAIDAPWWKLAIEAERTWLVHSMDQVAFTAQLVDLGAYVSTTTYREGNIVQNQGASWVYVNPTPSAGNAPPTLPTTSNTWWQIFANVGVTGNKIVTVFQRAASQPATPTGNGVPVGWALGLPTGTAIGWQSSAEQTQAGVLVGSWSTPARVTGDTGPAGSTGATGPPGRDVIIHRGDIAPGGVPVVGDTWVTVSLPRVWRVWDGGAWVQILGDAAAVSIITNAYIGVAAVDTLNVVDGSMNTLKLAGATVFLPSVYEFSDVTIPSTGADTTIGTTGSKTIGDVYYGSALVWLQGQYDGTAEDDAGAALHLEVSVNGGAWTRVATVPVGTKVTSGAGYSYQSVNQGFPVQGVGYATLQARIIGTSITMPGRVLRASTFRNGKIIIGAAFR